MLRRIKICELLADTTAQSVDCLHDKQMAWVRILASVRFFICTVTLFLLCYAGKTLKSPILTGVCIIK